jgi:hypothetical protein
MMNQSSKTDKSPQMVSLNFKTSEPKMLEAIVEEDLQLDEDEIGHTVASPRDFFLGCDFSKKRSRMISSSELSPGLIDSDAADEELNLLSLGSPYKRQKL